ncbi:MAG: 30S ribosome-binding factor RbfA [Bacillota bacterium]|nr:30S ribosome-binding factor RbfA [Bacillota bacterium]
MSFSRIDRISEEIKKETSNILRDIKDPRMKGMVSILAVKVSKDLSYAKIYVSILGAKEDQLSTMQALKSAAGFVRRELSGRVDLRVTPQVVFELSDSIEHEIHISKMIADNVRSLDENE